MDNSLDASKPLNGSQGREQKFNHKSATAASLQTPQEVSHTVKADLDDPSPKSSQTSNNTKLNGLRNRKIQRPPPLVLDSVSNFYNECNNKTNNNNNNYSNEFDIKDIASKTKIYASTTEPVNLKNNQNGSNQKFWASLSRNAQKKLSQSSPTKADQKIGSDLIITHRNNDSMQPLTDQSNIKAKNSNNESPQQHQPKKNHDIYQAFGNISLKSYEVLDQDINGIQDNSGGGNIIGVEATTPPPASNTSISTTSSRPISTNPFLACNESINEEVISQNFAHRPASFIAATEKIKPLKTSYQDYKELDVDDTKQTNEVREDCHKVITTVPEEGKNDIIFLNKGEDFADSDHNTEIPVYSSNNMFIAPRNFDSTINEDSRIHDPPPSAQLPHWTEAIYELDNAIIEKSSVAGGSENGQFIYIAENGDIVLELDSVKVSGYSIDDFVEILESKPVHLLKAVQTKHSRGMTLSLKQYLSCSFPKLSADKDLQDLIRENIYKRTIPCTTRPPKDGELNGIDYNFLTREQFIQLNNDGLLLECGTYRDHFYGTMRPYCDSKNYYLQSTQDVQTSSVNTKDLTKPLSENIYQAMKPATNRLVDPLNNPSTNQEAPNMMQHSSNHYDLRSHNGSIDIPNPSPSWSQLEDKRSNILAVDSESLPIGWERVIDKKHGTYYIDHNTQRTQYERPFEVELIKNEMGLGFTLLETDCGYLIVRSVIVSGPAHFAGTIKPGDILISAMGMSLIGLQDTDVARLFSTFALGDRIRLVFARGGFVDTNVEPDEFLFSNGTNGNLSYALNPNSIYAMLPPVPQQPVSSSFVENNGNDYDLVNVTLCRGYNGFGFEIKDSPVGQKVRKIQNSHGCTNLQQGDILMRFNGEDISNLTHQQVADTLIACPIGQNVSVLVKRRRRFRSKTPLENHSQFVDEDDIYGSYIVPQRNCKTPSTDYHFLTTDQTHPPSTVNSAFPPDLPLKPITLEPQQPIYYESSKPGVFLDLPQMPKQSFAAGSPYHDLTAINDNLYANREQISLQNLNQPMQYLPINPMSSSASFANTIPQLNSSQTDFDGNFTQTNDFEEYEYHEFIVERGENGFGFNIIGGAEADRAITIGSIVLSGAASKKGQLKSGDEILSINGFNVVGATHEYVVGLISSCADSAAMFVRRKKFAEACEVVLNRSMDEGFGFVIISDENCALIGRIIDGSPAHRCQQLHVKDRIISVNGRYITRDMQHADIVNMIKGCGNTLRLRIIPVDCYSVELIRNEKGFGFSIRGGAEHNMPLYVLRFASDGRAKGLLNVGDEIIEINGVATTGMTHEQAVSIIKCSDPIVKLKLRRNHETPLSLLVDSPRSLQKFDQVTAEMTSVNQSATPHLNSEDSLSSNKSSSNGNIANQQQQQQQLNHQQQDSQQQIQEQNQTSIAVIDSLGDNTIYGNSSQQQALYAN